MVTGGDCARKGNTFVAYITFFNCSPYLFLTESPSEWLLGGDIQQKQDKKMVSLN